jgi:hypothetical protein
MSPRTVQISKVDTDAAKYEFLNHPEAIVK